MYQHEADPDRRAVLRPGCEHAPGRGAAHLPEPRPHILQPPDLGDRHLHRGLHRRLPRDGRGQSQEGRGGVEQERLGVRRHPHRPGDLGEVGAPV